MELKRNTFNRSLLAALLLSIFLSVACQKDGASKNTPDPVAPPASPLVQGGGLDGSGGDLIQSTPEQVRKAIKDEVDNLPERVSEMARKLRFDTEIFDFEFGTGSRAQVDELFKEKPTGTPATPADSNLPVLVDAVTNKKIKITPQETCETADGTHAGSAKGNLQNGEICLSITKLTALPPRSLNSQIMQLLIHELSHVAGFNEPKAVAIQNLVARNPFLYVGEGPNNAAFYVDGLQSCNLTELNNEITAMNNSPYWKEKLNELLHALDGKQSYCLHDGQAEDRDKVDIFTDDAERIYVTPKFAQTGFNWHETASTSGTSIAVEVNNIQGLFALAGISIYTNTAVLRDLNAKIGTDAQCSPKILLANVLASLDDIIGNTQCAPPSAPNFDPSIETAKIKARIAKEREILRNAPN